MGESEKSGKVQRYMFITSKRRKESFAFEVLGLAKPLKFLLNYQAAFCIQNESERVANRLPPEHSSSRRLKSAATGTLPANIFMNGDIDININTAGISEFSHHRNECETFDKILFRIYVRGSLFHMLAVVRKSQNKYELPWKNLLISALRAI